MFPFLFPRPMWAVMRLQTVSVCGTHCRLRSPRTSIYLLPSANMPPHCLADTLVAYTLAISHAIATSMSITTVFTNNRSQAVRLPADVRLPEGVKKVQVRARGVDRIISPVGHTWDEFFLNGPRASDDFMAERASQQQPEREAL
jgi:antitoxin VapB